MSNETKDLEMPPTWGRRLLGLDGLRGFAATSVLIHHVFQYLGDPDGSGAIYSVGALLTHGLTLFFVLSGFLLFRPFASAILVGSRPPSLARYFRNRGFRIFPAYVVILFVAWVLGVAVTGHSGDGSIALGRTDALTSIADLTMLQTLFPPTVLTGISVAWSLTTELTFYLLLPVLFLAARWLIRSGVNRLVAVVAPAAVLAVISYVAKAVVGIAKSGLSPEQAYDFSWGATWTAVLDRSILVQGDLFAYGMVAAIVVTFLQGRGLTRTATGARILLAGSALVLIGFAVVVSSVYSTSLVGAGAAAIVLVTVLPDANGRSSNLLARVLEFNPLWYLGLISYSMYLWHTPVIWWIRERGLYEDSPIGVLISCTVVLVVTVALSTITYFAVERPALRLKSPRKYPQPA